MRLEAGEGVDLYPLFVRPVDEGADVLFVAPTNTYLAYANDHFAASDMSAIMGHERVVSDDETFINAHPEFGLSCYDRHKDGSPVRYSSRRRPLLNVRPHYPNWLTGSFRHFAVDLFFLAWLERLPHSYHVVTDQEVHERGSELLSKYKAVVTGSHPEYWTSQGLTALEDYALGGGRILYLGGNGFYWVTSIDPISLDHRGSSRQFRPALMGRACRRAQSCPHRRTRRPVAPSRTRSEHARRRRLRDGRLFEGERLQASHRRAMSRDLKRSSRA